MLRKWLRDPKVLAALTVLAAGLILYGGINGIAAAPSIQSTWFGAQANLDDIDVALTERSGDETESRLVHGEPTEQEASPLLTKLVPEGEDFVTGRTYTEKLAVKNTLNDRNNIGGDDGNGGDQLIKEYVRVTVYRYWETKDEDDNYVKNPDLNPAYIKIGWSKGTGWTEDESVRTAERNVLYYGSILHAGEETKEFTDSVTIDSAVLDHPEYKDARFVVWAEVNAVQTHNADDAMMSAWGKNDMIKVDSAAADSLDN